MASFFSVFSVGVLVVVLVCQVNYIESVCACVAGGTCVTANNTISRSTSVTTQVITPIYSRIAGAAVRDCNGRFEIAQGLATSTTKAFQLFGRLTNALTGATVQDIVLINGLPSVVDTTATLTLSEGSINSGQRWDVLTITGDLTTDDRIINLVLNPIPGNRRGSLIRVNKQTGV